MESPYFQDRQIKGITMEMVVSFPLELFIHGFLERFWYIILRQMQ